jgi:hypothetical protein
MGWIWMEISVDEWAGGWVKRCGDWVMKGRWGDWEEGKSRMDMDMWWYRSMDTCGD